MTFPELLEEARRLGFTHVRVPPKDHHAQSGTTVPLDDWKSPRSPLWDGFQILSGEIAVDELAGGSTFRGAWPLMRHGPPAVSKGAQA